MGDLLKVEPRKEATAVAQATGPENTEAFTLEQLHQAWEEFAVTKRALQAEYHLLSQPLDLVGTKVELHLLSPVQETMLGGFKADLIAFLRTKLKNDLVQVVGVIRETDDKKMIYTPRDKFEYLQGKIPILKEFKDRLGLDTDF
jgi:DNA polymerase-3 subunit gamma/tau